VGRRRSNNHGLPPRLHKKGNSYYYVTTGKPRKWIALGSDLSAARLAWAQREAQQPFVEDRTFLAAATRYRADVMPQLRDRTQRDYDKHLRKLSLVFDDMLLDEIKPPHIVEYLRLRGQSSKTQANREKAVFSSLFNHARGWGMTEAINPSMGVRGHRERSRDRYVDDKEYLQVYEQAAQCVRDAMDLALLTAQRMSDVLDIKIADVRDSSIEIQQSKTGKRLRIRAEGELAALIAKIALRPCKPHCEHLLRDDDGERFTYSKLRYRFEAARKAAGVHFRFTDLRAKSATDLRNLAHAQALLGHRNRSTTEIYTRERLSDTVPPLR
jgi:integrase